MISHMRGRRGFTLIELLIVSLVMGILATVGLPRLQGYRKRAEATAILTELKRLEFGLHAASEGTGRLPAAQAGTVTDPVLAQNLPAAFQLTTARHVMAWVPASDFQSGTIMLVLLDGELCGPIYSAFGATQSSNGQITFASCPAAGGGGVGMLSFAVR